MGKTKRNKNYHFLRNPKTTQEKREYFDATEQGVKPRTRRNPRNLVSSWDDIPVAAIKEKKKK